MEHRMKQYRILKNSVIFSLSICGIWPNISYPRILKWFQCFSALLISGSLLCFVISFSIKHISIYNIISSLSVILGCFTSYIKVSIFIINQKHLQDLNKGISANFEKDLQVRELQPHLLYHFNVFFRIFYIYRIILTQSALSFLIIPLLALRNNQDLTIFPVDLPWDYKSGGFIRGFTYGYEILNIILLFFSSLGVDSIFGLYCLHMVGELKILSHKFKNLSSKKCDENDFKKCVEKHCLLIKSKIILEKIYGFLTLWPTLTSAIIICSTIFQLSKTQQINIVKLIFFIGHLSLKLIQAYNYAWYGHIITVESENCLNSIYNSQWPGCNDKRFMKNIIIVLCQKPLILKLNGWFHISLQMIVTILRASISYSFLIRTLDGKKK